MLACSAFIFNMFFISSQNFSFSNVTLFLPIWHFSVHSLMIAIIKMIELLMVNVVLFKVEHFSYYK